MDSKVAMSIIAATVTTLAAAVCTRKLILDKKQSNSPEKRLLKKKQRSMVKSLSSIETDSKKLLEDIKKVQGIILEFMKNSSKNQQNNDESENYEKTVIENEIDNNASIDSTDSVEKTIIDNEGKEEVVVEKEEKKEEEEKEEEDEENEAEIENSTIISTYIHEKEETDEMLASLQSIRVDGFLIEMKIKGLDEYLLRLLERLDSLRPKALMEEVREIYNDKEGLEEVIPFIEHKVEKIKKRKKALVLKIQSYLENVDKLANTVSGKNKDIEVVESVAKLWEVKDGKKKHLNFKFKL